MRGVLASGVLVTRPSQTVRGQLGVVLDRVRARPLEGALA